MADHEPTLGEVYRLVQTVQAAIVQMGNDARSDRDHAAQTFVRKDVLESQLSAVGDRITEAERDIEDGRKAQARQQDRNRQMVLAMIGVTVPGIIAILLWLLGARGGVS